MLNFPLKNRMITIRISEEMHKDIFAYAKSQNTTVSQLVLTNFETLLKEKK